MFAPITAPLSPGVLIGAFFVTKSSLKSPWLANLKSMSEVLEMLTFIFLERQSFQCYNYVEKNGYERLLDENCLEGDFDRSGYACAYVVCGKSVG
jgi:hypothetical protein